MTLPPATNGTAENTEHNEESQGQGASCPLCGSGCKVPPQTGAFVLDPTLPSYRSLGVSHSVEFIYNSLSADPRPIIPFDTIITLAATVVVPPAVSYSVEFGGVRQGREIFVKTSDLAATLDGTIRNALQLDASTFPTGSYPYELRLTSNYDVSRVSSEITGQVLVNNELGSPFGVGWTMKGLQRLHLQPDQSVVLTEGDGSIRVFATSGAAGDFQSPPGDFSTLQQNPDTTFTRTLKNGSRLTFDAAGLHKATVDRNGNTTSYMYDVQGRLIQITDPKDLSTVLRYAGGLLSLVTDSAGRVTTFIHDTANNLTKVTYPDNSTETFSYDGHLLTGEINQRGFTTTHQYDFAGRFVHSILPDTSTRAVSASQLVGLVDPSGGLGTPTNPAPVYRPKQALGSFTDGNLNTTVLKTDSLGNITKQTDALGRTTVIERDPNGNPTRITRPNGTVTTMTYDARGNLLTSTELGIPGQPDPAFPAATTFTYEPTFNQVKTIKDPKENVTTINYDPKGNPIEIIDTKGTHTLLRYDDPRCLGQLTSVTSAAGKPEESTTAFEYDPTTCNLVKTTDPLGNMTTLEYDTAGNVVRSTDAEGRVTRFQYDVMNHLTKVIDATNRASNPACGTAGVTCYDYDPRENLIRVMDARGKETSFEYDALDRLVRTIDPLGKVGTFSYDGNSNLASTTDRKIQTINFEYNAVNQLLRKVLPGNLETFFRYDVAGNLKVVEAPSSEVGMVYDPLGRLQSTETIIFEDTSNGPPVTITQPTTIGPTDRQFDGTALTIAGAPVVIDGQHTFAGLILKNGAVVSHSAATATGTSQLDLRVGGTVAIDSTSRIDVTGKGFLGGLRGENASSSVGRTLGNTTTGGSEISAGGSYGGLGGLRVDAASIPNGVYGDFHRPLEPGSGGGAVPCLGGTCMGGNGGGMARITATTIALSGRIRADGGQADLSGGGGSGGAIFITTSSLQGAGSITADGGGGANGGGGGGGRVAVIYDNLTGFDPDRISAASGLGENLGRHGGAGTIFLQSTTQTNGDLIVDNRRLNVVTGLTPLRAIRPGTSTALAANVLTNTATTFRTPDPTTGEIGLIGLELNPNTAQNQTFTVVGNTGTTLTTDSADGDMTSVASSGNSYIGVYTFDNLTVRNGANMTTVDNCVVLGTLTVTGGSANCNNLTQSASLSTNNLIVQAPARTKPGMRLANFSGGPLTLSLSHEGRGDSQTNSTIQNPQSPIHNLQSAPAFRIRHSAIEAGAVDPSYTYDKNGNRLTMTDPTGTTTYTYDELNRLTSLTNPSSQTIEFDYDALSHRTQTTFPNGTTASFAYDPASQLLSLVNKLGATTLSSFEYTYDKVGNRKMLDQQCSAITVASPLSYMYDNLNRLIEAIRPLPANPLETFNYDPVGNRLRRDGQTTDAIFDAANRLREDQRFCYEYDDNGNLTKKTVKVGNACTGDVTMYTYDAENRLIRIDLPGGGIAKYRYDGLGRRIEKSVNGEVTRYVYDNEDILFETDAAGSILARYTHGPGIDEPLIMERGSQRFFYHTDGLGSITELTDSTGAVAQAYVYDSFGQIVQQAGTLPNLYTYTGREFDPESGLYYYRARYYDAGVGRFLQEDLWKPIKGMNLYGYVRNNPVNRTDPSGLVCLLVGPGPFDVECDKKEEAKAAAEAFRARMLSQGFTVQVVPHPPHKQGRKLPHYHVKDGAEFEYGGVYYNHFYYSEEEEEEKQEESVCVSNPSGPHLRGPIEPPFVVPSPLPILW
jgi:RHS repeat-associated protein